MCNVDAMEQGCADGLIDLAADTNKGAVSSPTDEGVRYIVGLTLGSSPIDGMAAGECDGM